MSQPPKSTILGPSETWVSYSGVFRPIATSLRKEFGTASAQKKRRAPLSFGPERSSALDARHSPSVDRHRTDAVALQRSRESAVLVPERFRAVAPSAAPWDSRTLSAQLLSRSADDTRSASAHGNTG